MTARTFPARFPGRCAADCGQRIEPGDDVTYVEDELVHAGCVDGAPEPRRAPICPACHLTQPCDCED